MLIYLHWSGYEAKTSFVRAHTHDTSTGLIPLPSTPGKADYRRIRSSRLTSFPPERESDERLKVRLMRALSS